jgi:GT2 family glycosyltransferase
MTLDDDMYVENGWLRDVLNIFEADQDIGVVGVPYTNPQSDSLRGGGEIKIRSGVVDLDPVDWDSVPDDQPFVSVDDVPGGTMVLRTKLLDFFNWDPQYFVGMGDIDKSMQILETDWKQVMANGLQFEHDTSTDPEYLKTRRDYRERHRSYQKFVSKWGRRYPLRRHLIFNYFFRLPWPVMSLIETVYRRVS